MPNSNRPDCRQDCGVWFFVPERCKECPHNNPPPVNSAEGFLLMAGVESPRKER
jgi:hypothetical protein